MSRHHIDFVARRRPTLAGACLLLAGLATFTAVSLHGWTSYKAQAQAQQIAAMAASQQAMRANSTRPAQAQINLFADARWQTAMADLRWPWQAVLQSIENSTRPPVLLMAVRPNPSNGTLALDGEAPTVDATMAYLDRLQRTPSFGHAQLLSHDETTDTSTGLKQIKFTIAGPWKEQP